MLKKRILMAILCLVLIITSSLGTEVILQADAVFGNCDSLNGWSSSNSLVLDTTDIKEGTGAISSTGDSVVFFQKALATPINTGINATNGVLQLWLFVSDITKLGNGQIEVTSSGMCDVNETAWNFSDISLVNGWNKVYLNISKSVKAGGGADLSGINYLRIYNVPSGSLTMKLDDVQFVTALPPKASDDVLQLTVQNGKNGVQNYYMYNTFSTSSYTFQTGDYLEYDVYLSDKVSGSGGIDITTSDSASLRDSVGWQDQFGVSGHPAANISAYANKVWLHRKLAIPAGFVGKSIARWNLVGENDSESQIYTALYDNIVITNGSGIERKVGFKSTSDLNCNINDLMSYTETTRIVIQTSLGSGDYIKLTVANDATNSHYFYNQFSTDAYIFQAGDFLEYDVKNLSNTGGSGGVDCITTDDFNLRDQSGWQDQNGISGHPAADISAYANNLWYHRKLAIPASMFGKTAGRWDVVGSSNEANLTYTALYDNIVISDASGSIKKIIFANTRDSNINSQDIWVLASSATMSFTSSKGESLTPSSATNPRVVQTIYPTEDVLVATYDVTDSPYSADDTGVIDATAAIKAALNDCYLSGGGVVFMPNGKYRITSNIVVPSHVTLRGDWQDPDEGNNFGTIIVADVLSGINDTPALISINGSGSVNGLTIYYPQQSAANPISYPYTFMLCSWGGDGPMSSTLKNITLINSYKGVITQFGNEMHNIFNLKGTALKNGIRILSTSDVGRIEKIKINNSYWSNAGELFGAPSRTVLDSWTRANGIGIEVSDVEWENFVNISLSDFNIGMLFGECDRINSCGTAFGVEIENTNKALVLNEIDPRVGFVFTNCIFESNQGIDPIAIEINNQSGSGVIFNTCTIGGGATKAINLVVDDIVNFQNCIFNEWTGSYVITASSGSVIVQGCTFMQTLTTDSKAINLTGNASGSILGNNFFGESEYFLVNTSADDVKRQDEGYVFPKLQVTDHTWKTNLPKPNSNYLFDVVGYPYYADKTGVVDSTAAIQNALNDAGTVGGTVYLPAGQYKVATHLTVPANVELRGSDDSPHRADYRGTVLYVYEGHNTSASDTDTAFITLNGINAGVKGITIYYPNMPNSSSTSFVPYPYAIRGNGAGVYAMNIAFVNAYNGVDFASNQCDGHYLNSVNGCVLKKGINVGGGSSEGWIEECHFNATYWTRTDLENWIPESEIFNIIFPFTRANLFAFLIGNAENEHMINNFAYGPNTGFYFYSQDAVGANVVAINSGVDGSFESYRIDGTGDLGVTLINQEACGVFGGTDCDVVHISGGNVKIFGLISMEGNDLAIRQTGGISIVQGAMFHHKTATVFDGIANVWNGIYFKDTGYQLTINSGVTDSNFWGNIGGGGFNYINNAGNGASFSNNITR